MEMTNTSDHIGVHSSALRSWTQTTGVETFDRSLDSHGNQDGVWMHAGEDVPWILKYVMANRVEALFCTLFSVALGLCFILLAVLCSLCCRWRQARSKGTFAITKSSNEGAGRSGNYASGVNKETEGLLNSGTSHGSSAGRTYSSPRLIRAEYARGPNNPGASTPSSVSNANVVGLYLSQAPKSRWSRASDATVWPLPPNALAVNPVDEDANHAMRTPAMNERPQQQGMAGIARPVTMNAAVSPTLPAMLYQNSNNTLPPHFQVHSTFAHSSSPTDYLFSRQSIPVDSRLAVAGGVACSPGVSFTNSSLLRKNPEAESEAQRKALSYQGGPGMPSSSQQTHSYLGPCNHPMSPPVLPAPASSPWPARNSQIMLDDVDQVAVPIASNHN